MERWSEKETLALDQFRSQAKHIIDKYPLQHHSHVIGDRKLLRFLRGHFYNIDKCVQLLHKFLQWREKENLEKVRQDILLNGMNTPVLFPGGEKIMSLIPQVVIGADYLDRIGSPFSLEQFNFSPTEILKQITLAEYILFLTYCLEHKSLVLEQLSEERERNILAKAGEDSSMVPPSLYGVLLGTCVIRDLKAVGLEHLSTQGMNIINAVVQLASDNFPEMMSKCYMVNTPWVFTWSWVAIKQFLPARTIAKIDILGSDYKHVLEEAFAVPSKNASLPSLLGGTVCITGAEPFVFDVSAGGLLDTLHKDHHYRSTDTSESGSSATAAGTAGIDETVKDAESIEKGGGFQDSYVGVSQPLVDQTKEKPGRVARTTRNIFEEVPLPSIPPEYLLRERRFDYHLPTHVESLNTSQLSILVRQRLGTPGNQCLVRSTSEVLTASVMSLVVAALTPHSEVPPPPSSPVTNALPPHSHCTDGLTSFEYSKYVSKVLEAYSQPSAGRRILLLQSCPGLLAMVLAFVSCSTVLVTEREEDQMLASSNCLANSDTFGHVHYHPHTDGCCVPVSAKARNGRCGHVEVVAWPGSASTPCCLQSLLPSIKLCFVVLEVEDVASEGKLNRVLNIVREMYKVSSSSSTLTTDMNILLCIPVETEEVGLLIGSLLNNLPLNYVVRNLASPFVDRVQVYLFEASLMKNYQRAYDLSPT